MPPLEIRWSETEARKPYARPFGLQFTTESGEQVSIALSGDDLLYYRQFQAAVLGLLGEVFLDAEAEHSDHPQRHWLDRLTRLLPAVPAEISLVPVSAFDNDAGRRFALRLDAEECPPALIEPGDALDYQAFQAIVAHQTGRLYRSLDVEELDDAIEQQRRWVEEVRAFTARPSAEEAAVPHWPWR